MNCNVIPTAFEGVDKYLAVFDYPNTKIKPVAMADPVDEKFNPIPPPALDDITSITFAPGESAWQYFNITFGPEFQFITIESFAMMNQLLRLEAGENTTTQIRNRREY